MSDRKDELIFGTHVAPSDANPVNLALLDAVKGLRVYRLNPSDTSYERLAIGTDGTEYIIDSQAGAAGGTARGIDFRVAGTDVLRIAAAGATLAGLMAPLSIKTATGEVITIGCGVEELTLSVAGVTTDTAANLLPANAIIGPTLVTVVTTITTAVNFTLGDATVAGRFNAASTNISTGTKTVGLVHWAGGIAADNAGPTQASAAKVRVTCNAIPAAGVLRIAVPYITIA